MEETLAHNVALARPTQFAQVPVVTTVLTAKQMLSWHFGRSDHARTARVKRAQQQTTSTLGQTGNQQQKVLPVAVKTSVRLLKHALLHTRAFAATRHHCFKPRSKSNPVAAKAVVLFKLCYEASLYVSAHQPHQRALERNALVKFT